MLDILNQFKNLIKPIEQFKLPNSKMNYDIGKVKKEQSTLQTNQSSEHKQFDRIYSLTVSLQDGTGVVLEGKPHSTGLDISFDIVKDFSQKTNKSTIKIFNLSPQTLKVFESKDPLCLFEVGYGDDVGVKRIFIGFITQVETSMHGADTETTIHIEDGSLPVRDTIVTLSYTGTVSRKLILQDIAIQMGLALEIADDVSFENTKLNNFSYIGLPDKALTVVCGGGRLIWSVQNGILQVMNEGGDMGYKGFVLKAETGLIGIPQKIVKQSHQTDGDSKRKKRKQNQRKAGWKAVCLLNPTLTPSDIVRIESKVVTGWFKLEKVTHKGEYSGKDWYTQMELVEIETEAKEKVETIEKPKAETTVEKRYSTFNGGIDGYNGNIDLGNRPMVWNEEHKEWSTVFSATEQGKDGKWYLFPTVIDSNPPYIEKDISKAMDYYVGNGRYLGVYGSQKEANAMAELIHKQQAKAYPV